VEDSDLKEILTVLNYHHFRCSIRKDVLYIKSSKKLPLWFLLGGLIMLVFSIFGNQSVIGAIFPGGFVLFALYSLIKKSKERAFIDKEQRKITSEKNEVFLFDQIEKIFISKKTDRDGDLPDFHIIFLVIKNKKMPIEVLSIRDNGNLFHHIKQLETPLRNICNVNVEFIPK
jgi:hypothetical protein